MKINGSWKIKGSREIYKNPWLKLSEDQVIRPDGKDGIYGMVEMLDGVSVLPIDDEGNVYLVDQFRYILEKDSLEVVSGSLEKNETALDAAKRELKEEAGIIADEWLALGSVRPYTTIVKSINNMFLARKLRFVEASPEGTEQIKVIKMKLSDAVALVHESKILHSPSCVLILKVKEYLR